MSRRLLIGKTGSSFRIRQSMPGFDAMTSSLDGIVFDSDFFPGLVITSGWFDTNSPASIAARPHGMSHPHGIGRKPDLVLAMATGFLPGTATASWHGRSTGDGVTWQPSAVGSGVMVGRYCTPFSYARQAVYAQGPNAGYLQSLENAGWEFTWDATQISIANYCYSTLRVKWIALDL